MKKLTLEIVHARVLVGKRGGRDVGNHRLALSGSPQLTLWELAISWQPIARELLTRMVSVSRGSSFTRDIDWLPSQGCADVIDGKLVDPLDALDAVEGYMRSEDDIWARYEIGVVHQH